jgi:hypothetical protein
VLATADGHAVVPVSLAFPGQAVSFTKQGEVFGAGITMVEDVRDPDGNPLGVYQRFFDLRLDETQYGEFRKTEFNLTAQVHIPRLESVRVRSLLQFTDGKTALASRDIHLEGPAASNFAVTSVVLTDNVRKVEGATPDPSNPLQVLGYELALPASPQFISGEKLAVYFGMMHAGRNVITHEPQLRISLAIEQRGKTVARLPGGEIVVAPLDSDAIPFLRQYPLQDLKPGDYSLVVSVDDLVRDQKVTRTATFQVH